MRPRRSSRPYYRSCSSPLPFFLFSKTRSGSRREPIARFIHDRLSKKFIVSKLQCFDNILPCHAAVSIAPRHSTHDCDRKEHALTQILCRLKQRFELWSRYTQRKSREPLWGLFSFEEDWSRAFTFYSGFFLSLYTVIFILSMSERNTFW